MVAVPESPGDSLVPAAATAADAAVPALPPGMCSCEVCNGTCAKRLKVSESQSGDLVLCKTDCSGYWLLWLPHNFFSQLTMVTKLLHRGF